MSDREWLLVPVSQKTKTATLDRYIDQALSNSGIAVHDIPPWGGLKNNKQRVQWLLDVRALYWNMEARRARERIDRPKARSNHRTFEGITASEADDFIATIPMPEGIT